MAFVDACSRAATMRVDRGVDPADEEAGHAGHTAGSPPRATSASRPGDVRLCDLLVGVLREEQRHVDVDALADELLDRGDALLGSPGL